MQDKTKYDEEKQQIKTLNNIINQLENNKKTEKTFQYQINLYGIINYSRIQFFPRISSHITSNKDYADTFFDYTTAESMILDLFMVIESDLILILEDNNYEFKKLEKLIDFSIKLLKILEKILKNKIKNLLEQNDKKDYERKKEEYTQELFGIQKQFYTLVYDEKIDFRVK